MRVTQQKSADGRTLLKVMFLPPDPEPGKTPEIEVIYEVRNTGKIHVLTLMSATREDTREPVVLTDEQKEAILEATEEFLADQDTGAMWGNG